MKRLGKPRHGRQGRRLSEREVSESNPVTELSVASRDPSTSLCSAQDDSGVSSLITCHSALFCYNRACIGSAERGC
jgi:hypothetical protein